MHLLRFLAAATLAGAVLIPNDTRAQSVSLTPDTAVLAIPGGQQTLTLDGGAGRSGQPYLVIGSASGTAPGTALASTTIPLNFDTYTEFTVSAPRSILGGSIGILDANGRATVTFTGPALTLPALAGLRLDHAALVLDPTGTAIDSPSNSAPLQFATEVLSIEDLEPDSTIATTAVDVTGSVGSTLSGLPGLQVLVNGIPAAITPGASGSADRYRVRELVLPAGINREIVVRASAPGTDLFEEQQLRVNIAPVTGNNVALDSQGHAFVARGTAGFAMVDLRTRRATLLPPPTGTSSVGDLAVDGSLLFLLDTGFPGRVTVVDANTPSSTLSPPVPAPVGPFAGISAANGRVVISGGTSLLNVRSYTPSGQLSTAIASIDLGIGQPDVVVTADGAQAFVSTDFSGSVGGAGFGITTIALATPPVAPTIVSRVGLPGSGFTPGSLGPANFPIVAAEVPAGGFVAAHGGGLSLSSASGATLLSTLNVGALNHAATTGDRVFALGFTNRLVEAQITGTSLTLIDNAPLPVPGSFRSLDANADHLVAVANAGAGLFVRVR